MNSKLYATIASLVTARKNCVEKGNLEWKHNHTDKINSLVKEHMPSGSGVDCGTHIDLDASHGEKLVFTFSYHHMNDAGMYDGWTDHKAIVTPSLAFGYRLNITGRDRNGIKECMHEVFSSALDTEVK